MSAVLPRVVRRTHKTAADGARGHVLVANGFFLSLGLGGGGEEKRKEMFDDMESGVEFFGLNCGSGASPGTSGIAILF
jgi:hypothetical protein